MRPSHLIDKASCTKVLGAFLESLGGDVQRFQDLCTSPSRNMTRFPCFTLFQEDTYKWFLPKPAVGVADFMRIYEEFADRPLGSVPNPGKAAAQVYTLEATRRKLTHFKQADQWMSPARILLAASLWLGGEVEASTPTRVAIRFGSGILEVTNAGCWTNRRRMIHPAACEAFDQGWPATTIYGASCRDPVLHAVSIFALGKPRQLMYAGTVLATALNEDVIDKAWLRDSVMAVKAPTPNRPRESMERALVECSMILDHPEGNVLEDLYDAAVPNLMSCRAFRARFGVPSQGNVNRRVSAKTAERWKQIFSQAAGDAE